MSVKDGLARLRVEDPSAAAVVVDALWEALAREEPRMFAALWRKANLPGRRPAVLQPAGPPPIEWIEEPVLPSVNLLPPPPALTFPTQPASSGPLMIEPSPSLADLLPAEERASF